MTDQDKIATLVGFIEPLPHKAGDPRFLINGCPCRVDFRIIAEEGYKYLLAAARANGFESSTAPASNASSFAPLAVTAPSEPEQMAEEATPALRATHKVGYTN